MDAFNHQDFVGSHLQSPGLGGTTAGFKIIDRGFNGPAIDQFSELMLQIGQIQGFQAIEIRLTVFGQRGLFLVDKIIIHRQGNRF